MTQKQAVAIVGMGAILPDAFDVPTFWKNIQNRHYAISEVPSERWRAELYFDADPAAVDKTYSKIGGWVKGYRFNPFELGIAIPPRVLELIDEAQQWAVAASRQALDDFGYPKKPLNPERVAVIFGNAMAGEGHYRSSLRIRLPEYLDIMQSLPDFQNLPANIRSSLLQGMQQGIRSSIADITEDTMPGELSNIIAGRVANIFNFSGPNFVTDAACASSLAAMQAAVDGLLAHHFDAALTGGIDRNMGPESFVKFSKIGALSPDGSRPYADGANGFVMGEGAVVFLLRRLEDAEKDGDRIYAVIRGLGGSSDGKGKGITAPNPLGQQRAIERAWRNAAESPASAGLIEGHGTSTRVGDVAEVNSLMAVLEPLGLPVGKVALGSVKSNIGHLKSAAGAAGVLKVALALHHRLLPPTANFEKPNPNIPFSRLPVYPITELRPWDVPQGTVRRAGVSSFGFGGTNFHAVLEEYLPGMLTAPSSFPSVEIPTLTHTAAGKSEPEKIGSSQPANAEIQQKVLSLVSEKTGYPIEMLDLELDLEGDLGIDTVKQAELFASVRGLYNIPRREDLRLSDYNTLSKVVRFVENTLAEQASSIPAAPVPVPGEVQVNPPTVSNSTPGLLFLSANDTPTLKESLAQKLSLVRQGIVPEHALPSSADLARNERLAIAFSNADELVSRAEKALKAFEADGQGMWTALSAQGIFRGSGKPGKVAFLFPGQGSQYINMLRDLYDVEPEVRRTFLEADQVMTPILGRPLSSYIFVDGGEQAEKQAEKELRNTVITQPAMLTANIALLRVLQKYGFQPDLVVGHSLGEYAALVAAGVLTFAEALEVVSARGREMSRVSMDDNGAMLAVSAPLTEVEEVLKKVDGYAVIANINSPMQCVVGGSTAAIESAASIFQQGGFQATRIPVSHAFHTRIVAPASEPLRQVIARMNIQSPRLPVIANVTGEPYPASPQEIIDLLARQIAAPVQMVKSMQTLYAMGARVFVEVGPKRVLNALATDNLKQYTDVTIIGTNHPRKGGPASLTEGLCALFTAGLGAARSAPSFANTVVTAEKSPSPHPSSLSTAQPITGSVVISGTGLGLPGRSGRVFSDDNIQRLLRGEMLIEPLSLDKRAAILEKRATRLVKSEADAVMQTIDNIEQTIKLAGQSGAFDLEEEYGVDKERVEATDIATRLAIAAGIDALRDAGIPLVMAYRQTSRGTLLPDRWRLPEALADETGVIFASAFPGLEQMALETSRYYQYQALVRQVEEIRSLQTLLPPSEIHARQVLSARLAELQEELNHKEYHFDRRFIFRVLSMGHSQFAEHVGARGPNTHVNAACATTTHAVSIAEDWIRAGRCRRVVIVAGDDVSNEHLAPWIGTGLMASGAATTEGNPRLAILPFDRRRNGMIMGMGAAALVIESEDAVRERGMQGIAEILATHTANSAFHGTRLDIQHVSQVMDRLLTTAEQRFGISRSHIAPHTVFISHETYTPARGGSASAEIHALRQVFGSHASRVVIANTKGFTGHTMGVGVEDVLAVKALEYGIVPPIANIHDGFEPDPQLGDLNLSHGGTYPVQYALRLGAGFGSQIAMTLTHRIAVHGERIHQPTYNRWLADIAGYEKAELEVTHRTLRIRHDGPPTKTPAAPTWRYGQVPTLRAEPGIAPQTPPAEIEPHVAAVQTAPAAPPAPSTPQPAALSSSITSEEVKSRVLALVAEKTGYPLEMLDLELDLEGDLGIDTVKQAELFAAVRGLYNIPRREDLRLSDYNTLARVIQFVQDALPAESTPAPEVVQSSPVLPEVNAQQDEIKSRILALVAEKTGYPLEMLDLELDLEGDLGIDTVKQAELFAAVRGLYNIPRREDLRLSDYNTLARVIQFVQDALQPAQAASLPAPTCEDDTVAQARSLRRHYHPPMLGEHLIEHIDVIQLMKEALSASQAELSSLPQRGEIDITAENIPPEPLSSSAVIRRRIPVPVLRAKLELCVPTSVTLDSTSRVLVVRDAGKTADALLRLLRGKKIQAFDISPDKSDWLETVKEIQAQAPIQGVYFLPALEEEPLFSSASFEEWHAALERRLGVLYSLVRTLDSSPFLVCATRMGGLSGIEPSSHAAPLSGAVSGFAKALAQERPDALIKVVDFDQAVSPREMASRLYQETLNDPAAVEVGWENNLRFTPMLYEKDLPASPLLDLHAGTVYVVSGGSGGIIAPVLSDLAQAHGGIFYLIGRTPLPAANDPDLPRLKNDRSALKVELSQRLAVDGKRATPAQVEKYLAALERGAATQQAMRSVEAAGASVHYLACDVTDPLAVQQAVAQILSTEGHVDVLIHAAGQERSRRLESKPPEEFHSIVSVKVDGFYHLFKTMQAAGSLPRAVVLFSSIAGRFGNSGQVDYSAANDLLNKLAASLRSQYPATRFISLDWGAWGEVGMASRGGIPEIMQRVGIDILPPAEAAAWVRRELLYGSDPEVVLAGSLGMLDAERHPNGGLNLIRANTALREGKPIHKMLSQLTGYSLREGIRLEAELDPASEPFLKDHTLNGVPVLPGVMGIEGFSVASRHIASVLASPSVNFSVSRLEDIRFLTPFKFYRNQPRRILWKAQVLRQAGGLVAYVTLESDISRRPAGTVEHILHFTGRVHLQPGEQSEQAKSKPPRWNGNPMVKPEDIYQLYFHGPSFQVLDGVQRAGETVIGRLRPDLPPLVKGAPAGVSTAVLVELCFQTAGLWEASNTGVLGLPGSIGSLRLYRACPGSAPVFAEVTPCTSETGRLSFNARVLDAEGCLYLEINDYRTSPLPYAVEKNLLTALKPLVGGVN